MCGDVIRGAEDLPGLEEAEVDTTVEDVFFPDQR
jgi:hypothetical protein